MVWCVTEHPAKNSASASPTEKMPVLDPVYSLVVAILVAFVFAHAATHKTIEYARHLGIVADYQIVPVWLVPLLAPLLIVLEFAATVLVLLPATRPIGLILAAGLLLVYLFSIGLNLLRGRTSIDCGCGWGSQQHPISGWLLIRNLLFVTAIASALLPHVNRSLHLADWILVALAGSALIAIYHIGDLLIANSLNLRKLKSG